MPIMRPMGGGPGPGKPPVLTVPVSDPGLAQVGLEYVHKVPYKWAGANLSGWDCSGMWNWILSHRFNMTLPGGVKNFTGSWHGPVVLSYSTWGSAVTVPTPEVGDFCIWVGVGPGGHMGVCTKAGPLNQTPSGAKMVSALDVQMGTAETFIEGFGPAGAPLRFRRLTGIPGGIPPGLGCSPVTAGAGLLIGGMAWIIQRRQRLGITW